MKLIKVVGSTSQLCDILIQDSTSTTGAGKTGLAYNTPGLTAYYHRSNGNASAAITLATMTLGTWASGGFKEVDATNMPGVYQIGIPDAVLASGATSASIVLRGATGMVDVRIEIQLTAANLDDGTRLGLTALPNAAAEAAGGLYTRGTGAGQINQPGNGLIDVSLKAILNTALTETAGQIAAAFKQFFDVASPTGTMKAITSVDSVSGAVGSVTGNVGGNVVGSVASVTAGVTVTTNNDKTGYALSAAGVQAIWDALTSALSTASSIGKLLVDNINATISSRMATFTYTAPPSAADNADAVWDEAIAGHLTAGSAGAKLNSAAAAGDPWSTALPGSYASGEAGNILAAINSKTAGISTGTIAVTSPVVDADTVTIVRGDDYKNADGRALFATTTFSNAPSLTGATVRLKVKNGTTPFTKAGTVTGAAACYVELTTAETAAFSTGSFAFDLEATLSNGDIVTIAQGRMTVNADVR